MSGINGYGCYSSGSLAVNVLPKPTLSITPSRTICSGETITLSAKSNAAYMAHNQVKALVAQDQTRPVPMHLRNAPTKMMKQMDYGKDYRYAHDEPDAYAAGERYFPDGMPERTYYQPVQRGLEIKIAEKLARLKALDRKS